MHVVVATDSFGGLLSATAASDAVAEGWRAVRPDDEVEVLPLSDGGEGLLDVLHRPGDDVVLAEVAGPRGLPVEAWLSLRTDGTAVVESALACGLALLAADRRDPLRTTTWGVGELLDVARAAGARRILVGLGGSATVDGGAGALSGLGFRLRVADGSGLKIGGEDLPRVTAAERGWVADFGEVEVVLLADVTTTLLEAAAVFGPQKGADDVAVAHLERGLRTWADVAERDLAGGRRLRELPGTGAAGGLGFGLAAGLGARLAPGAATVADLVGLEAALSRADLVITGEGRLDATSFAGKVVGHVLERARAHGVETAAVAGRADAVDGLGAVELAPASDAAAAAEAATAAGERLARRA